MAEKGENQFQLPVQECFKAFEQSFNRIKYFLCIVDSLNYESFPADWQIKHKNSLTYAVDPPKEEKHKQNILEGLKHFTRCYLVRDVIESFAVSIDSLVLILLVNRKRIRKGQSLHDVLSKEEKELLKNFESAGLSSQNGKIQLLKTHFQLSLPSDQAKVVTSLKDIRNCFAHGNGFVRPTDGKRGGKNRRKFHWKTTSIFAVGIKSGKKYPIELNEPLPEESNICVQIEDHNKSFNIGEQMQFFSYEVYEIAFSLQQVALSLISELNNKLSKS